MKIHLTIGKSIVVLFCLAFFALVSAAVFSIFFDQAFIISRDTVVKGNTSEKVVALTFDDGPSKRWTPRVLEALRDSNVKATFFMLGEHVVQYPEIARQVVAEGHEVGNHTYDHKLMPKYRAGDLEKEIGMTDRAIFSATGVKTNLVRPPKGWITDDEKKYFENSGHSVILWSLNAKDWVKFDYKYIVRYLSKHIEPGSIILFHDAGGVFYPEGGNRKQTVKAIKALAEELRQKGYRFVTISEMMELSKKGK